MSDGKYSPAYSPTPAHQENDEDDDNVPTPPENNEGNNDEGEVVLSGNNNTNTTTKTHQEQVDTDDDEEDKDDNDELATLLDDAIRDSNSSNSNEQVDHTSKLKWGEENHDANDDTVRTPETPLEAITTTTTTTTTSTMLIIQDNHNEAFSLLQNDYKQLELSNQQLKQLFATKETDNTQLQESILKLNAQNLSLTSTISLFEEKITKLQDEKEACLKENQTLNQTLVAKNKEINDLNVANAALSAEIKQAIHKNNNTAPTTIVVDPKITTLEQSLKCVRAHRDQFRTENKNLKTDMAKLEQELATLKGNYESLDMQYNTFKEDMSEEIQSLKKELNALNGSKGKWEATSKLCETQKAEIVELKKKLAAPTTTPEDVAALEKMKKDFDESNKKFTLKCERLGNERDNAKRACIDALNILKRAFDDDSEDDDAPLKKIKPSSTSLPTTATTSAPKKSTNNAANTKPIIINKSNKM